MFNANPKGAVPTFIVSMILFSIRFTIMIVFSSRFATYKKLLSGSTASPDGESPTLILSLMDNDDQMWKHKKAPDETGAFFIPNRS